MAKFQVSEGVYVCERSEPCVVGALEALGRYMLRCIPLLFTVPFQAL